MKRNIKNLLFSAALLLCCLTAGAVGTQPSTGDGSKNNPYQIATLDNLLWFADYVNTGNTTVCAELTADITMNAGVLDSNGNPNSGSFTAWTPIGGHGVDFGGEFDGNGHTISGLYFNDETKNNIGLFGKAANSAQIHDLGIKDSYFCGNSWVAGICGNFASGRIENCWNGATVIANSSQSGWSCAGGIAASCWTDASVRGCYNIGKVSVESSDKSQCGGICGTVAKNTNVDCSVSNCVSLEGKCDMAYNLYNADAVVENVVTRNGDAFESGEVCYLLNSGVTDGSQKWYQTLGGIDNFPVLDNSHGTVFYGYNGDVLTYSNTPLDPPSIDNVAYIDANGQQQTADNVSIIRNASEQVTWSAGWYVVQGPDITLAKDTVCNGAVNLILADGAKLTATGNGVPDDTPGIQVSGDGNSLAIYGQTAQSGQLFANGGDGGAGIGGKRWVPGSNITINGGIVTATGGDFAAGIGGGMGSTSTAVSNGFNITINGGTVVATGGRSGAGIGGGFGGDGSHITINGGNVTATGGMSAAGIGGGAGMTNPDLGTGTGLGDTSGGSCSDITITGGNVTATGGSMSAGIGIGSQGSFSNINITGGTVTATGGSNGSGIGGGNALESSGSGIFVATTQFLYAGDSENPTTEIENTGSDLASKLAGKQYVITEPKPMFTVTYGGNITVEPEFESGADIIYGTEITFTATSPSGNDNDFMGFYKESTFETPITDGVNINAQTYTVTVTDAAISVYAKFYDGNPIPVTSSNTLVTWGAAGTASWYIVNGDVQLSQGATCNGAVHLILADGAKLTATGIVGAMDNSNGTPGIRVSGEGTSLTIYGQTAQSGQLIATGGYYTAGIGGGEKGSGSNITINGGIVTANSRYHGAGIGGGDLGKGSNITINGGLIAANGGQYAAGIGGGRAGSGSNITINGGTVTANCGYDGSTGIGGGGATGTGSNIKVDADLIVRADGTEIAHTSSTDIAGELAGKPNVTITSNVLPVPITVSYIDENGVSQTVDADVVAHSIVSVTWGAAGTTTWYVVNDADVLLARGAVCNGDVRLILADGAKLTARGVNDKAGIQVSGDGNSLTIYCQTNQSGQLFATGGNLAAGIGGGKESKGSNITIYGGTVTATGGDQGAGIGGGNKGSGANITIKGGTVTATGGNGGSGIGGGREQSGSDITIKGGTVTATGGNEAAGIGGGFNGNGSGITIDGGTVTATGGNWAAGIGGGREKSGSNITIYGGIVTANGNDGGAGIGGGQYGSGSNIIINNGIVTATGGAWASGIGGGFEREGCNIVINGGIVTANSGRESAGIGGGQHASGHDITINGGEVTANGGENAAGIGRGKDGNSSNIKVAAALTVYADNNNPPTTEIMHATDQDITSSVNKRYVMVKDVATGAKEAAIAAINAAIEGVTNTDIIAIATYAVDAINAATSLETINALKEQALAAIASAKAILNSGLGEMGEPCEDCPAVEVTKGDNTIKLYNPESVKFKKE